MFGPAEISSRDGLLFGLHHTVSFLQMFDPVEKSLHLTCLS